MPISINVALIFKLTYCFLLYIIANLDFNIHETLRLFLFISQNTNYEVIINFNLSSIYFSSFSNS